MDGENNKKTNNTFDQRLQESIPKPAYPQTTLYQFFHNSPTYTPTPIQPPLQPPPPPHPTPNTYTLDTLILISTHKNNHYLDDNNIYLWL